jgi:predicted alpha/beta-fold hydrolase
VSSADKAETRTGQEGAAGEPGGGAAGAQYRAPLWLPGGHLQTIYPAALARRAAVDYRRERWDTPDGDFIDVDFVDGKAGRPLLVLFHGMEGSSDSHYARAIMACAAAAGWSGAIPHFRSCSGELNREARFYHCADYEEADWVLRRLAQRGSGGTSDQGGHQTEIFAAGVSLGGSVLLQWLARSGEAAAEIVSAACAICAPLDVAAGGRALARRRNRVYARHFLQTLKPKAMDKLAQHPGLYDAEAVRACGSIYDFDRLVTAPLHGFTSVEHYWESASTAGILRDIAVPTLVLKSLNDPFVPAESLPQSAQGPVVLEYVKGGGHLGFTSGRFPGRQDWLPRRLMRWFAG